MNSVASTVSIGICTSNDGQTISSLLDSCQKVVDLFSQRRDIILEEILVISSGSSDDTNTIIQDTAQQGVIPLNYRIEEKRNGKADAINQIIELNRSQFLVLIPADVKITEYDILELVKRISGEPSIGVVSGKPIPNFTSTIPYMLQLAISVIWTLHNQALEYTSSLGIASHSSGELMIVRKSILKKLPSKIINDDAYLALHSRRLGYQVGYAKYAVAHIDVPTSIGDYILQRRRIIIGHQQLGALGSQPSNFRYLLYNQPLIALHILISSITSIQGFIGLLYAIVIELWITFELTIRGENDVSPVWQRIKSSRQPTSG